MHAREYVIIKRLYYTHVVCKHFIMYAFRGVCCCFVAGVYSSDLHAQVRRRLSSLVFLSLFLSVMSFEHVQRGVVVYIQYIYYYYFY